MRTCGTGEHDGACIFVRNVKRDASGTRRPRRVCACNLTPREAHRAHRLRVGIIAAEAAEVREAAARVTEAGDTAEAEAREAENDGIEAANDRVAEARQVAETEAREREESAASDRMERGGRTRSGSDRELPICPGCRKPVHRGGFVDAADATWHRACAGG